MNKAFQKKHNKPDNKKKQYIFSSKAVDKKVDDVEESNNKYVTKFKKIGANIQKQNEKFWGFK